jgi:DNA-binding transcriptional ArsR family regulator
MARATSADLLARVCAEIDARLAELRPAVEEYERLLGAADALEADAARAVAAGAVAAGAVAAGAVAAEGPADAKPVRAGATRPRTMRRSAAGASGRESSVPRTAAAQAIVAALEHGSHTVAELVVVTAMSGPEIRESLRALQRAGKVTRAKREGRTAYALAGAA